jgi:hypothetical protein
MASVFAASAGFCFTTGATTLGLGVLRLTGATLAGALAAVFAGTFLAVTIRPHTKI